MTAPSFFVEMPTPDIVEDIADRWGLQAEVDNAKGQLVCFVPALSIEYSAPLSEAS